MELLKDFYTVKETAELLRLTRGVICRKIKAGEIPARKFGKKFKRWMIKKQDLLNIIGGIE
jgi:excisionase family DNA binding protein